MDKEKLQMMSFEIISFAGEAFSKFYESVENARTGKIDEAHQLLDEGKKILNQAHNTQTSLLTIEAEGKSLDFSVILIHAQDHLMTTIMYERIAKQMISIFEEMGRKNG